MYTAHAQGREVSQEDLLAELQQTRPLSVLMSEHVAELRDWAAGESAAAEQARIRSLEDVERDHIIAVLEQRGWRVSGPKGAASLLGLKPTTLEARMKKLGIQRPAPQAPNML